MWWCLVLYVSFASALFSSAWMFSCLLIACLIVYLFLYWLLWRVWNLTLYCFQKTVSIFGIYIDLLYQYFVHVSHFSVLLDVPTLTVFSLCTWHVHAISCMLLLDTYLILPDIWHVITWHLPCLIFDSYNYHLREWWPDILIFIYISLQHVLMILLTCSCSFL